MLYIHTSYDILSTSRRMSLCLSCKSLPAKIRVWSRINTSWTVKTKPIKLHKMEQYCMFVKSLKYNNKQGSLVIPTSLCQPISLTGPDQFHQLNRETPARLVWFDSKTGFLKNQWNPIKLVIKLWTSRIRCNHLVVSLHFFSITRDQFSFDSIFIIFPK